MLYFLNLVKFQIKYILFIVFNNFLRYYTYQLVTILVGVYMSYDLKLIKEKINNLAVNNELYF